MDLSNHTARKQSIHSLIFNTYETYMLFNYYDSVFYGTIVRL